MKRIGWRQEKSSYWLMMNRVISVGILIVKTNDKVTNEIYEKLGRIIKDYELR